MTVTPLLRGLTSALVVIVMRTKLMSLVSLIAEDESEMKALMQEGVNDFKVLSYELEYVA
jgi:hypothetical protein